jgi:hypothetical protein
VAANQEGTQRFDVTKYSPTSTDQFYVAWAKSENITTTTNNFRVDLGVTEDSGEAVPSAKNICTFTPAVKTLTTEGDKKYLQVVGPIFTSTISIIANATGEVLNSQASTHNLKWDLYFNETMSYR